MVRGGPAVYDGLLVGRGDGRRGRCGLGWGRRRRRPVAVRLAECGAGDLPANGPNVAGGGAAKRQDRVHVGAGPVPAAALESRLDDDFVGALDDSAADGVARSAEGCITQQIKPLRQVLPGSAHRCQARRRLQSGECSDDRFRVPCPEGVELDLHPGRTVRCTRPEQCLSGIADVTDGVNPVDDAQCVGAMVVR
jgi:hypothetical protein